MTSLVDVAPAGRTGRARAFMLAWSASTRRVGLTAGLLAVALALLCMRGQPHVFPLDDAYIHLAYGRSLAQTGLLALNPGEPSVGTSSPLWSLALVPLVWLCRDPFWSVHILCLASVVGYVVLATRFLSNALVAVAISEPERRGLTALGAFLLATNGSLLWMSLSGMETCLTLFVAVVTVAAYVRAGPGALTGVLMGLCLLARTTTLALLMTLVLFEVVSTRRIRRLALALLCAFAMYAPFASFSWRVTGSFGPNTAKGKLLTYVTGGIDLEQWLHFCGRALAFHQYLPACVLLSAAIVFASLHCARNWRGEAFAQRRELAPIAILATWGCLHVAQYMFAFRTIGQQGRYLAEWLLALTIVGTFAVGCCLRQLSARAHRVAALLVIALVHVSTLPYWIQVYRHNVTHVSDTYVKLAERIRDTTPADARVASFDIGAVRYIGNRYTIDLGGLVDTTAHRCLEDRSCGEYMRQRAATHVMYPKGPEADKLTGIQQSSFAGRRVLKEVFLAAFTTADYAAPTLTHSFTLELFRIDGWFDRRDAVEASEAVRADALRISPKMDTRIATTWTPLDRSEATS